MVLVLEAVRAAIERGFKVLNMGVGSADYKARLGASAQPAFHLRVRSPSRRPRVVQGITGLLSFMR